MTDLSVKEKTTTVPLINLEPYLELIAKNGPTGRKERNIPADTVAALEKSGIFRALVPKEMGGLGATPQQWFRALITLAEQDMSWFHVRITSSKIPGIPWGCRERGQMTL